MKQMGNRFLDLVPFPHPTFTVRDPYTATLGVPISINHGPRVEGTTGFYLTAGGGGKNIYLITARHVVLPVDKDDNEEYQRTSTSKVCEDVMILGASCFDERDRRCRGNDQVRRSRG